MFDLLTSLDRETLRADFCREVIVGESVAFAGTPVPLATEEPLRVIDEPAAGAAKIDGASVTFTAPGFYYIAAKNQFGKSRAIEIVAWEQSALDWLVNRRGKKDAQGATRWRPLGATELRYVLRSLSNHDRRNLTGTTNDLFGRNLALFGA